MTAPDSLVLDGVGVRFRGLQALSGVSLTLRQGELAALIGPNGAGKSTLLNVVSGALAATTGEARFRGRPVIGGAPHRLARAGLVRTFQGLDLFDGMTVLENAVAGGAALAGIGFWRTLLRPTSRDPRAGALRLRAEAALAQVGLEARAGDPAAVLPAGQRRLLAIARALAAGADWLLLDEPGAGLNEAEKARLVALLRGLHESGRTILFVEHDMGVVARLARRILVLDRGRLIADGEPASVRRNPEVIAAYLGVEAAAPPPAPAAAARPAALLEARGLTVAYGGVVALREASIRVGAGELVAVVGANGAGKSTLLKALAGALPARAGEVRLAGQPVRSLGAEAMVRRGVALVPEGRELFASLSVEDNLLLGHWSGTPAWRRWGSFGAEARRLGAAGGRLAQVYEWFPRLGDRRRQAAGSLSGGEAQMVAIGRALMAGPRVLLLDEPSLGLAPMVVAEILERLRALRDDGMGILLVEQIARAALAIADHGYLLETGRVVAEGTGPALLEGEHLADAYLGDARAAAAAPSRAL